MAGISRSTAGVTSPRETIIMAKHISHRQLTKANKASPSTGLIARKRFMTPRVSCISLTRLLVLLLLMLLLLLVGGRIEVEEEVEVEVVEVRVVEMEGIRGRESTTTISNRT